MTKRQRASEIEKIVIEYRGDLNENFILHEYNELDAFLY